MHELITVCIPTYNRSVMLLEAIESVQKQTIKEIKILILDNCSSDDTAEVVTNLSKTDSRVVYYRNEINLGQFGNISKGIELTETKYWSLLMDDDIWSEDFLEHALNGYNMFPEAGLYSCWAYGATSIDKIILDKRFGVNLFQNPLILKPQLIDEKRAVFYLSNRSSIHPSTWFTLTEKAKKCIPLYSTANWGGDWLFSVELINQGGLIFDNTAGIFYRIHPTAEKYISNKQIIKNRIAAEKEVGEKIFGIFRSYFTSYDELLKFVKDLNLNKGIIFHILNLMKEYTGNIEYQIDLVNLVFKNKRINKKLFYKFLSYNYSLILKLKSKFM